MPTRGVALRTYRVPDLTKIDRSCWRAVLGGLGGPQRFDAARALGIAAEALPIALSLPPAPCELARDALTDGPSLPMPEVRPQSASRQVNVRLSASEHEELRTAAKLLGLTPTAVARLCIVTGVRRAITDHDAALERLRPAALR